MDMNEEIDNLNSLLDSTLDKNSIELKNMHSYDYIKDSHLWLKESEELFVNLETVIRETSLDNDNTIAFIKDTSLGLIKSFKEHIDKYESLIEAFRNLPKYVEEENIVELQAQTTNTNLLIDKEYTRLVGSCKLIESFIEQFMLCKKNENELQRISKSVEGIKDNIKCIKLIEKVNRLSELKLIKKNIDKEETRTNDILRNLEMSKDKYNEKKFYNEKIYDIYIKTCNTNIDFVIEKYREIISIFEQVRLQHKNVIDSQIKEAMEESDRRSQYWLAWCQQQCNVLEPNYDNLLKPLTRKQDFDFTKGDLTMFEEFHKGISIRKTLKNSINSHLKKLINDIGEVYNELKVSDAKEAFNNLEKLIEKQTSTLESLMIIENFSNTLCSNIKHSPAPFEDKLLFETELVKFNEVLDTFKDNEHLKNLVKENTLLSQFQAQSEKVLSDYEKLDETNKINEKISSLIEKLMGLILRLNEIKFSLEDLDPKNHKRIHELGSEYGNISLILVPIEEEWNELQLTQDSLDQESKNMVLVKFEEIYKIIEEMELNFNLKNNTVQVDKKIKELKNNVQDFVLVVKKTTKVVDSNTSFLKDLEITKTKLESRYEHTKKNIEELIEYFTQNKFKDFEIDKQVGIWNNIDVMSLRLKFDERISVKQQLQEEVEMKSNLRKSSRTPITSPKSKPSNIPPSPRTVNKILSPELQATSIVENYESLNLVNHYVPDTKSELDLKIANIINRYDSKVEIKRDQNKGRYWIGGKLVFCRILNSNMVMVRVGGGWCELSKYLKNVLSSFSRTGLSKTTGKGQQGKQKYTIDGGEIVINEELFSMNSNVRRNMVSNMDQNANVKKDKKSVKNLRPASSMNFRTISPKVEPNNHAKNSNNVGRLDRYKRSVTPGPKTTRTDF